MLSDVFTIFPTTIARYNYVNHSIFKKQLLELLQTTDDVRVDPDLRSRHYFERNSKFLDLDVFKDFKQFLIDSANSYCNDLMRYQSNMVITESWINQTDSNFSQYFHNHGNSFISATYYVNYDINKHSPIEFQNNKHEQTQLPYLMMRPNEFNELNSLGWTMGDLSEGQLVIWPSNLEHGYEKNIGDNRISIAVNFLPEYIDNGGYKFRIGMVNDGQ
jgi:uncharacterized protein (TIGR02466 family)